jgi:hypothetical protein
MGCINGKEEAKMRKKGLKEAGPEYIQILT